MKGLDLRNFAKIKTDAQSTTLKHPEGHVIVVAHANLSPKMKKDLHALPFADGGEVNNPKLAESKKTPMADGGDPATAYANTTTSTDPLYEAVKGVQQHQEAPTDTDEGPGYTATKLQYPSTTPEDAMQAQIRAANAKQAALNAQSAARALAITSGLAEGGEVEDRPRPFSDTDKYCSKHQTARKNCKCAYSMAEGGEAEDEEDKPSKRAEQTGKNTDRETSQLKGINKPNMYQLEGSKGGKSEAGQLERASKYPVNEFGREKMKEKAKDLHKKTLAEMKSAPKPKLYADGGEADSAPLEIEAVDPNSEEAQATQQDTSQPMPGQDQESDQPQGTQEPASQPDTGAPQTTESAPAQPPMSPGTEALDERNKWIQDLANQHITPETYGTLFAKKDTLGKVGTIFGMLLSGIGSGMSGQPNALMQMMNNQINNDLEAQKNSKANAQNFLRLEQQQQINDATIRNMVKSGQLTDAQAANIRAEAFTRAYIGAKMKTDASVFHDLSEKAKALSGPAQQAAQQTLGILAQTMDANHTQLADKANAMTNYFGNVNSAGGSSNDPESAFQTKNQALRLSGDPTLSKLADQREERHIPGVPGQASRGIPQETRDRVQAMNVLDNKGKDVLDFVNQHTGTWNPSNIAIARQKIEEMKNFYNDSIKGGALTQGRLNWYDEQFAKSPTNILSQLLGSTAKLKEMINSNATRRDLELKNLGFQGSPQSAAQQSTQQQQQPQFKMSGGVKYMRGPNGEAVRVK